MPRDPRHDVLFEPLRVGPMTLPNRFWQTPHCCGFGTVKPQTQAAFRGMKAEGGWGCVNTEYCSISPEADPSGFVCATLLDDHDVRNLALMCDAVHAHGALAGVQLWHGGANHTGWESRLPALAPSALASHELGGWAVPRAMEAADIRRVRREHVDAARRARSAGFDVVYVYPGHSYLLMQFLSPFYNRRTDAYGGSLANRARFLLETLEDVRAAVGDDCAIATRISIRERHPWGIDVDEALATIALADHLVDLWDVCIDHWPDNSATSRFEREDHEARVTARVKEHTAKPVLGVGRFTSPDTMARIVSEGRLDVIGAARPSIADPFLPAKVRDGRLGEIRECIGCNMCVARGEWGRQLICTQNATAGEEHRRGWHPERFEPARNADRDVLIVGAGAAGLECAVVLGKRGMRRVHLVDAAAEVGGYVARAATLPGLGEWARVVNWRTVQLAALRNVAVLTGLRLDAAAIREYGAEIVILAVGARWAADGLSAHSHAPIPGADAELAHVLTPEQVLDGHKPVGPRVVVYDCEGYFMGVGVAERLRRAGHDVVYVTPDAVAASFTEYTLELERLNRSLCELGIAVEPNRTIEAIAPGVVRTAHVYDPRGAREIATDSVVLVTQRLPDDALWRELDGDRRALADEGIEALYRIGDCVAPRVVADCVFDGHRLAREIDCEDPATALPYLRERPLVTTP